MEKKPVRILIKTLAAILIVLALVYLFILTKDLGYKIFSNQAKDTPQTSVTAVIVVEEGDSVNAIAKKLYDKGIVDNTLICSFAMRAQEGCNSIMPGEYTVTSDMRVSEIVARLSRADIEE